MWISAIFLSCLLLGVLPAKQDYKAMLSNLLGKELPRHADTNKPQTPVAVSRYMNRMFQRYRNRPDFTNTDKVIVRSLMPHKGLLAKSVDFDLSSIRPNENITKARLHVRYRPSKRRSLAARQDAKFAIYLVEANRSGHANLRELQPIGKSYHWLVFDIDRPLTQAMRRRKLTLMLGKVKGQTRDFVRSRKALMRHSPFLVVHTEVIKPADNQELGFVDFKTPKTARNAMHRKRARRNKRETIAAPAGYFSYAMGPEPENSRAEEIEDHLRQLGPTAVLQSRKDLENGGRNPKNPNLVPTARKEGEIATDYIPFSPENLNPKIVLLNGPELVRNRKPCGMKSLEVDFADIGWDNWIIEPHKFDAGYCDGSCSAKPGDTSHPPRQTNHAIIQNIIFNMGSKPSVPQPCCAPEELDSLSLLYYDEQLNIVLRNYPKMRVISCACL